MKECSSIRSPARPGPARTAALLGLALAACLLPRSAEAIVGPSREALELTPYVVMVIDKEDPNASYCTASVIDPRVLLTAAHCVTSPRGTVAYYRDQAGEPVLGEASEIEIHPGFRPDAARRSMLSIDLALVRLAEPLPASFRPVTLSSQVRLEQGQRLLVAGFGIADETLPRTGGVLREGILEATAAESPLLVHLRDPEGTGLGACTGDSGAPVFTPGRPVVVAVAIWAKGEDGQRCGALTQAVLVGPQRHWIDAILQSWARPVSER